MLGSQRDSQKKAAILFALAMVGDSLEAYDIGIVPVSWIARLLLLAACAYAASPGDLPAPGRTPFLVFFGWSVLVTLTSTMTQSYSTLLPADATTPYPIYVFLRFLSLLSSAAAAYVAWKLCFAGYRELLSRFVVVWAAVIGLAAVYIYFAQLYGLPEPGRNRIGTNGEEQSTVFSYVFHRAMGTFREPSHLAAWLVGPLFLSLASEVWKLRLCSVPIAVALLLTGSLSGMLAFGGGLSIALLVSLARGRAPVRLLLQSVALLALAVAVMLPLARPTDGGQEGPLEALSDRIEPLLFEGGLKESNRDYIYEYLDTTPVPWLGAGMGNANLLLAKFLGETVVPSFLSLYFNALYATGFFGIAALIILLFVPILRHMAVQQPTNESAPTLVFGAYVAWLILFSVLAEELTVMFGLLFSLVCFADQPTRTDSSRSPRGVNSSPNLLQRQ